jgi:XRE family transcriptional regulator of biofilm formation
VSISENLRRIRKELGISQIDLSKATGISNEYLSKIERGRKENPSMDILNKLSKALNCSVDELTGENTEKQEKSTYEMIEDILKLNNMYNQETQVAALILAKLRDNDLINEDFEMTQELKQLLEDALKLDFKINKNINKK